MKQSDAEILREYGPFDGVEGVHGVTFDGERIWFASGERLNALDSDSGAVVGSIDVAAHAGTAFDGEHLFQIAGTRILKVDPKTGAVVGSIPTPGDGAASGLAWSEGSLWVGQFADRQIHEIDPADGKVLRSIDSDRQVTGVTWIDGELWHGFWQEEQSGLRRLDPTSGQVLEAVRMPSGAVVSGLESDGRDRFFCGGGPSGLVRAVQKPPR